jgi:uncharacterized protein DUF3570
VRLQLRLAGATVLFSLATSAAEPVAVAPLARLGVYQDSDHTTILTAAAGATATVSDRWPLSARYLVDVVSSASVDVVSQATGTFHDVRHDLSASGGYDDDTRSLIAGYSLSTENDWTSHNVSLSGSHDLLEHNLTLSASLAFQTNAITRANSIGFDRTLQAYLATLAASYTLSPRDLVQLALASSFYDGFQSSPYRYVTVAGEALLENYPEQRFRQAVVLRYHHYFAAGWALRNHARFYADGYGVESLTLGSEAAWERGPFEWSLAVRGYGQTGAHFYREVYAEPQRYLSVDKEMSRFVDVFFGPTFGYHRTALGPFDDLRFDARLSGFYFHFFEFAALDERYGVVADIGLNATF